MSTEGRVDSRLWSLYVFVPPHCLMASPAPVSCCWLAFLRASVLAASSARCCPEPGPRWHCSPLRGQARSNLLCLICRWRSPGWQTTFSLRLWKSKGVLCEFYQAGNAAGLSLESTHRSFETRRAAACWGLGSALQPASPGWQWNASALLCQDVIFFPPSNRHGGILKSHCNPDRCSEAFQGQQKGKREREWKKDRKSMQGWGSCTELELIKSKLWQCLNNRILQPALEYLYELSFKLKEHSGEMPVSWQIFCIFLILH